MGLPCREFLFCIPNSWPASVSEIFKIFRNGGNEMRFDQAAFGCRLKEMRKERGFTQEQLAEALNISTPHLGNIEIGKRGISVDLLMEVSDVLNVSVDFLIRGTDSQTQQIKPLLAQIRELLAQVEALSENLT